MRYSTDERALMAAYRDRGQAGVLEWLSRKCPPPDYALDQLLENGIWNDEMEVDQFPLSSEGDGGSWVSAWVWASKPDEDIDEVDYPSDVEKS